MIHAGIVAAWVLGVLRLFYWNGSAEHDAFMMAAGIVSAYQTGEVINGYCYGSPLQFLFYYLFRVATLVWSPSTSDVLLTMNILGVACALAIPFQLIDLFSRLLDSRSRAHAAVLLLVSSPVYFFLVGYGHPFHLALVLVLWSWQVLERAGVAQGVRWIVLMVVALLLQTMGLMIRFEQVMLVNIVMMAAVLVREKQRIQRLAASVSITALATLAFVVGSALVGTAAAQTAEGDPSTPVGGALSLLLLALDPRLVRYGLPHLLVEVGAPLLIVGGLAFVRAVAAGRWLLVLAGLAGTIPTLFVYIGNPSPPRHFFVLAIAVPYLVVSALEQRWIDRVRRYALPMAVLSLFVPWALIAVDGQPLPDRSEVTYNVIERTDRNIAQTREAFPFYRLMLERAAGTPVVVYAEWIHVAQISSVIVDDPAVVMTREALPDGLPAFAFRRDGLLLYLVETHEQTVVNSSITELRKLSPGFRFLTLLNMSAPVNDLAVPIPSTIRFWSS